MPRFLILLGCLLWPALGLAAPRTVAVLYFENGGTAYDALKVGLTQLLISDLVGTPDVRVVERTALQGILDELSLGHQGVTDPATAAKVGKLVGAEWLLLGTYFELGGQLYVQSRMVHVETGQILAAHALQQAPDEFHALREGLSQAWRTSLTTLAAPPADDPSPNTRGATTDPASRPESVAHPDARALDAAIALSEGLIYLDGKDVTRAREAFQIALSADPRLQEAQSQLAALAP